MAHTPKHGSWLDLAESELGILAAQCLDEMGGVEFCMRPARQIQQLATARQRRSKRADSNVPLHRAQRSATLAAEAFKTN